MDCTEYGSHQHKTSSQTKNEAKSAIVLENALYKAHLLCQLRAAQLAVLTFGLLVLHVKAGAESWHAAMVKASQHEFQKTEEWHNQIKQRVNSIIKATEDVWLAFCFSVFSI